MYEDDCKMYEELEKFLSREKLEPYLKETNNNREKALKLFKYNLEVSSQMYKALQIFELATRNIFNIYLSKRYGFNWINRTEILSGNNNKNCKLNEDIMRVKNKFIEDNKKFNNNDIISSLTMGFWVNLLSFDNNDKLWQPTLKKIFTGYERSIIHDIFIGIKEIRNRIAHQETIFNKDINKIYNDICFILKIYSNDLYKWFGCECDIKIPQEFND